jgi:hypothetical protein
MRLIYYSFKPAIFALILCVSFTGNGQSVATYSITFESFWDTNHSNLPGSAHWSQLVGANHNGDVTFLEMGEVATFGIERIAEEGVNSEFRDNEVQPAIDAGNAEQYIDGDDLASAGGTITISGIEISEAFPLLTLVSMIAPSPDWMISINSLDLRSGGDWAGNIELDLFPYDAGTDAGTDYTSTNDDTTPHEPISSKQDVTPFSNLKIGTLSIHLDTVLSLEEPDLMDLKIFPNPSNGMITISNISDQAISTIGVYDLFGRLVHYDDEIISKSSVQVNLKNLSTGVYILKVNSHLGNYRTQKLILD